MHFFLALQGLNTCIGITHVLSCITIMTIGRVPRKLFEHEAATRNIQTSLVQDTASVNAMEEKCLGIRNFTADAILFREI